MKDRTLDPDSRFVVGNRVRTILQLDDVPAATIGTVQQVFFTAALYLVQFDGWETLHVVHHVELELMPLAHTVGEH